MIPKFKVGDRVKLNPNKDYGLINRYHPNNNTVYEIESVKEPLRYDPPVWKKRPFYIITDGMDYPEGYLMGVK